MPSISTNSFLENSFKTNPKMSKITITIQQNVLEVAKQQKKKFAESKRYRCLSIEASSLRHYTL